MGTPDDPWAVNYDPENDLKAASKKQNSNYKPGRRSNREVILKELGIVSPGQRKRESSWATGLMTKFGMKAQLSLGLPKMLRCNPQGSSRAPAGRHGCHEIHLLR